KRLSDTCWLAISDRERAVGCSASECQRIVLRWNLERGYLHPAWGLRFCPRRLTDRRRSRVFRRLKLSSLRCCWSWGSYPRDPDQRQPVAADCRIARAPVDGARPGEHVVRDAACGLLLINSTSAQDCGSDCVAQRLRTWR